MRVPVLAVPVLLALALAASPAHGQERRCDLLQSGGVSRVDQGGMAILTFTDPFAFECDDGTQLRANSGTLNDLTRDLVLIGNVFFEDVTQTLTAEQATYNSVTGRLYATGDVVFTNRAEGSTIRGPELEYYRAMEGRPEANVNARQRPHLTLRPKEQGSDAEPLELDADQVTIFGQDVLNATGEVVITRTDLRATSGEAQYNAASGALELRREAQIVSNEFTLAGEVVQAQMLDGVLEHVHARTNASVDGKDLRVTAPDLQLFFADELLQRAVARAPEDAADSVRAVAVSHNFRLSADSIDAVLPAQKLETVVAIGGARGEAIDTVSADSLAAPLADSAAAAPDSTAAAADTTILAARELVDRDWMVGDTIIGFFEPGDSAAAPSDTAVVLKRLVAKGNANSLYRVAQPNAAPGAARSLNFLSGEVIEITFAAGELQLAEVTGLNRGLYLEPTPVPAAASGTGTPPSPPAPPGGGR